MTKSERRRRQCLTAVRLTPAEQDFIAQRANEAGESLSGFMREAALGRGGWTQPRQDSTPVYQPNDQVRVVGGKVPAWMHGQLGTIRGWDGSTYEVLVRNKAGFPWYVQLSPTQVEAANQSQEDT